MKNVSSQLLGKAAGYELVMRVYTTPRAIMFVKESGVVIGIEGRMPYPLAPKAGESFKLKTGVFGKIFIRQIYDALLHLFRDLLVSIHFQYPVMSRQRHGVHFLLLKPFKLVLTKPDIVKVSTDVGGCVGAEIINNNNFIGPLKGLQAGTNLLLVVFCDDKGRNLSAVFAHQS